MKLSLTALKLSLRIVMGKFEAHLSVSCYETMIGTLDIACKPRRTFKMNYVNKVRAEYDK